MPLNTGQRKCGGGGGKRGGRWGEEEEKEDEVEKEEEEQEGDKEEEEEEEKCSRVAQRSGLCRNPVGLWWARTWITSHPLSYDCATHQCLCPSPAGLLPDL